MSTPLCPADQMGQHPLFEVLTACDDGRVIFCTNTPKNTENDCTLNRIGQHQWVLTCPAMHTAQITFRSFLFFAIIINLFTAMRSETKQL